MKFIKRYLAKRSAKKEIERGRDQWALALLFEAYGKQGLDVFRGLKEAHIFKTPPPPNGAAMTEYLEAATSKELEYLAREGKILPLELQETIEAKATNNKGDQ